jgi:hypothetical protein
VFGTARQVFAHLAGTFLQRLENEIDLISAPRHDISDRFGRQWFFRTRRNLGSRDRPAGTTGRHE